jgi:hypothetical protein
MRDAAAGAGGKVRAQDRPRLAFCERPVVARFVRDRRSNGDADALGEVLEPLVNPPAASIVYEGDLGTSGRQ